MGPSASWGALRRLSAWLRVAGARAVGSAAGRLRRVPGAAVRDLGGSWQAVQTRALQARTAQLLRITQTLRGGEGRARALKPRVCGPALGVLALEPLAALPGRLLNAAQVHPAPPSEQDAQPVPLLVGKPVAGPLYLHPPALVARPRNKPEPAMRWAGAVQASSCASHRALERQRGARATAGRCRHRLLHAAPRGQHSPHEQVREAAAALLMVPHQRVHHLRQRSPPHAHCEELEHRNRPLARPPLHAAAELPARLGEGRTDPSNKVRLRAARHGPDKGLNLSPARLVKSGRRVQVEGRVLERRGKDANRPLLVEHHVPRQQRAYGSAEASLVVHAAPAPP
mmetsp:Transcript_818/g.3170  ORF Transcript_818/g.3170 Transcript_818/m.3170 type:complete len:341 (-) Transcript_818:1179-2201(-)